MFAGVRPNIQMQRTCQKRHAFCLRKSRATFATPLI
jgi:hypothetical protein